MLLLGFRLLFTALFFHMHSSSKALCTVVKKYPLRLHVALAGPLQFDGEHRQQSNIRGCMDVISPLAATIAEEASSHRNVSRTRFDWSRRNAYIRAVHEACALVAHWSRFPVNTLLTISRHTVLICILILRFGPYWTAWALILVAVPACVPTELAHYF